MPLGSREEHEKFRHLNNCMNQNRGNLGKELECINYAIKAEVARAMETTSSDLDYLFEKTKNMGVIVESGTIGSSKKYVKGPNYHIFERLHNKLMEALEEWEKRRVL